jgi:putative transposase
MNRGARRLAMFERAGDYDAFVRVMREAADHRPMRILDFAVMPNHWHLVLGPEQSGDLSAFMAWLTGTHVRRWHAAHGSTGSGTLYQGRFKAIAVKDDHHFLTVCHYVERNPVRAGLVARAGQWRWSSASRPAHAEQPRLHEWPVARPPDWDGIVEDADSRADVERLRRAIRRSLPYGTDDWCEEIRQRLGWPGGHATRGRPHQT